MSLSRPARFPLLKLPFLCIECVIKSWRDIFDIIFFALVSKKTRQIVKFLKIPLSEIRISLSYQKSISLCSLDKHWIFKDKNKANQFFDNNPISRSDSLVLQIYAVPFYTSRAVHFFESYTDGNEATSLKMAIEFLNEVFKCSVIQVWIGEGNFPESGDIGVSSTENLVIDHAYGYAKSQELRVLLENLKVTDSCKFYITNTEKDFYVDPKLFKCKSLFFKLASGAWVTRDILLQFEVPQMSFFQSPFSVEDTLSFVVNWFHSEKRHLEYLYISSQFSEFPLETFRTAELNPVPFSERNRVPLSETFIDFSKGLEIVRHDGLLATIHVTGRAFLFYIWHDQTAITQN